MRQSKQAILLFVPVMFLLTAGIVVSGYGGPAGTNTVFTEDFEQYAQGAREIKSLAVLREGRVEETGFHPASTHSGERILWLCDWNAREQPDGRGKACLETVSFPVSRKLAVSFWLKITGQATAEVLLIPEGSSREKSVMVFHGQESVAASDLDAGWEFIKKEVDVPSGVSKMRLWAGIILRTPTGEVSLFIDGITIVDAYQK